MAPKTDKRAVSFITVFRLGSYNGLFESLDLAECDSKELEPARDQSCDNACAGRIDDGPHWLAAATQRKVRDTSRKFCLWISFCVRYGIDQVLLY